MIEAYYNEAKPKLLKQIRGRGVRQDLVEDVLQESFARALKYIHTFDSKRNMPAWFNTLMNNAIRDCKKEDKAQGVVTARDLKKLDDEDAVEDPSYVKLLCKNLEKELVGRKESHKHILFLYFMQNLPPRDICQITEEGYENVRRVLQRFKVEMKEKYGEREES